MATRSSTPSRKPARASTKPRGSQRRTGTRRAATERRSGAAAASSRTSIQPRGTQRRAASRRSGGERRTGAAGASSRAGTQPRGSQRRTASRRSGADRRAGGASLNPLKARLATGKPACGILISMPGVGVTQTLAGAGFDWLFIDMEHGPITIESTHAMIAATKGTTAAPLVRVPWNVHWLIKPVLDAGAMGIIVPMVKTRADAQAAVQAVRYPPTGDRGWGPFYASLRWDKAGPDYADAADRDVACVLLIEHKDAVKNIKQIASVKGVDACLIAPFDLAMSYGFRDGPDHQAVQRGIRTAEKAILDAGITLGGLALTPEAANDLIGRGYQMILCGFDVLLLQRSAAQMLDNIRR